MAHANVLDPGSHGFPVTAPGSDAVNPAVTVTAARLGFGLTSLVLPFRQAPAPPDVQAECPNWLPDLTSDDWDALFRAVRARLEDAAGTLPAAPEASDAVVLVQSNVLECVEALGQLHAMLEGERRQRERLELAIVDLRTALALALSELIERSVAPR